MLFNLLVVIDTVILAMMLIAVVVVGCIAYNFARPMLQLKKHASAIPVVKPDILKELNLQ